jgi:hypothetical protein
LKGKPDDPGSIESVAFSPNGQTLIASGRAEPKAGMLLFWDAATFNALPELTAVANTAFPTWADLHRIQSPIVEPRAAFSPTGGLLAVNCVEKHILLGSDYRPRMLPPRRT